MAKHRIVELMVLVGFVTVAAAILGGAYLFGTNGPDGMLTKSREYKQALENMAAAEKCLNAYSSVTEAYHSLIDAASIREYSNARKALEYSVLNSITDSNEQEVGKKHNHETAPPSEQLYTKLANSYVQALPELLSICLAKTGVSVKKQSDKGDSNDKV